MSRPNLLIFMTDHQRGDTVLPDNPTLMPNVDRLAADGITFSETYCPSPHCCPARATFHSGLYPQQTGIWNNVCNPQALQYDLNEGVRLWSEDLADAGYDMAYAGKWHVNANDRPADRGWKHDEHASGLKGTLHGQKWDLYKDLARQPVPEKPDPGHILKPGWNNQQRIYRNSGAKEDHMDTVKVNQAADELQKLLAGDSPWAICVNTAGPHDPYDVPGEYLDMYDLADIELPENFHDEMADKPNIYNKMRQANWGKMSEDEIRDAIRHFRAYCTFMDDLFGGLVTAVDEAGQTDNTIVVFVSDHGDYCGEHGLFCKGIPGFRGAYHVPLVIRWPEGIQESGRRIEELVSLADFGPTILEACGIETNREFAGASLMPFMQNEQPGQWRDDLLMQCNGVELYYTQRILMSKDHKLVYNGFDYDELYDRNADPHEMKNLNNDPAYDDIKKDMFKRMWRAMESVGDEAINAYITTSMAPWGPAEAFRD